MVLLFIMTSNVGYTNFTVQSSFVWKTIYLRTPYVHLTMITVRTLKALVRAYGLIGFIESWIKYIITLKIILNVVISDCSGLIISLPSGFAILTA
jgi:hypothetical protein